MRNLLQRGALFGAGIAAANRHVRLLIPADEGVGAAQIMNFTETRFELIE
jgi:hypothetical protein